MGEKNIFIFTAADSTAQANFNKTIIHGVDVQNIIPFIDNKEIKDSLEKSSSDSEGVCYVWGTRSSEKNDSTWRKMKSEDLVLGYWGFSIHSASCVVEKIIAL